jgi:RNA polymerase sigma factor (sigma-70 family)
MVQGRLHGVLDCIRRLAGGPAESAHSDRHLLERFARQRDEESFAELVRRHGPLVWGVCRRVLGNSHDAEDAFQAVFLVLARRAGAVRWHDDVGKWLYGVAVRIARKARAQHLRQGVRGGPLPDVAAATTDAGDWQELRPLLDDEISRLPEKYRVPIVLCYLQGKTYGEAAKLLGWAEGTVSGRLARARDLLRGRLLRRGLAPSAILPAALPSGSAEAVPTALADAVVRAAPAFALKRGFVDGLTSRAAVALANEGMRSMMFGKGKIAALVFLILAAAGTSAAVLAMRAQPEKQPDAPAPEKPRPAAARPPLKKEWQGRWDANPFAGTTAIGVEHRALGGPWRTQRIDDPDKVAALMKLLTIRAFRNDFAQGNIPASQLTFHKKGKESFNVTLDSQGTFQSLQGSEIYVDPAFLAGLQRQLADRDGQEPNLTQFLPAPPKKEQPPATPTTLETLQAGFKAFTVQYLRGRQLREAHLTDRMMLDELEKSFVVLEHVPDKGIKGLPSQSFVAVPKTEVNQHWPRGHFLDREHLFVWDIGRLTVKPSFVKTLNEQLSRLEGRAVDVLGDNKPPREETERERKARSLLQGARAFRYTDAKGLEVVVNSRKEVEEFIKALTMLEASAGEWKAKPSGVVVEVTTARGEKVRLKYFETGADNEKVGVAPLGGDLVEVVGIGQVWLDRQWRYRFMTLFSQRRMEEHQQRILETTRLVGADLPAFLDQVVNLVAYYREGESQLSQWVSADASRPILAAMKIARIEKLDWTEERWRAEGEKLEKRGAGSLDLVPGHGFSLPVMFSGEKELLVPMVGRVHLENDITPLVKRAVEQDPDRAKVLRLLPDGP